MSKINKYLKSPKKVFSYLNQKFFNRLVPDVLYVKSRYKERTGKKLNLKNPQSFNEKLQWLKLYDRNPLYTKMVDKFEAKEYVAEKMGKEYIIPTLGVWDKFSDIDFDSLPNQFVLKTTHDSGGVIVCKDKENFDALKAEEKINRSLKNNYYWRSREWPYKNVKPRIIAEKFLEDMDELVEYKMFCFSGEVKVILVCKGQAHGVGRTNDYCDLNLKRLPFTSLNPNSDGELPVPKELPLLIDFAKKLSVGIPEVRVDTYLANGKIYFGELTFFHNSGFAKFNPPEWDLKLGEYITLPKEKKGEKL